MSVEPLDPGENSQHLPSKRGLLSQVEEGCNEDDLPCRFLLLVVCGGIFYVI